jgi:hypothetical protein
LLLRLLHAIISLMRSKLIGSRLLNLTLHTLLLLLHRGGHHHLLLGRGSPVVTRASSDRTSHAWVLLLLLLLRRHAHALLSCGAAHALVGVLILVLLHGRTSHHARVQTSRPNRAARTAHLTRTRWTHTTNLLLIGRLSLLLSLPVVLLWVHLLLLRVHTVVHHGMRPLMVARHRRLAHTIHAIALHGRTTTHLILSMLLPLHRHLLPVEVALWRRPFLGLLSLGSLLRTTLLALLLLVLRLLLLLSLEISLL